MPPDSLNCANCPSQPLPVMGAGLIGCIHTAGAHARGARVFLSEPVAVRRELVRRFEPEWVIDPGSDNLIMIVRECTD